jgi:hypothetical protein
MCIDQRSFRILALIAASGLLASLARADGTLIRWHKMGEEEGGTNNTSVFTTLDSPVDGGDIQPLDLTAANTPTYRTIVGRPDGGGGIGIEFNGAQQENLSGLAINWPQQSPLAEGEGGLYDLEGIDDRGLQFWLRPTSTAAQSLVMDTNEHGVRINSSGNFSMRYGGTDFDSTFAVTPNTWYHIQLVRPNGPESLSRLYVNGNAVAVSTDDDYSADQLTPLTVGSNTAGNGEFFSGIIDDLRFTVYGTTVNSVNYGSFNFAAENVYADFRLTGVPGDLNHSGTLTQADKDAFIAGWMDRKVVNGVQIGDLSTFEAGDINFDGITDIFDLVVMQGALPGAGMGAITEAELFGLTVPEPSALVLVMLGLFATGTGLNRPRISR